MRRLWYRLVALGFRLLYHEMAWTYDAVSWLVSLGRWRQWQRSIWPYLPPDGRILEVGFGPGHLLADLAREDYGVVGLDSSVMMTRLAYRRLQRKRLHVAICQALAQSLPFGPGTFSTVIATFPTEYVYDPRWLEGVRRVLKPQGQLLIVETVSLGAMRSVGPILEWLFRITGQRGYPADLVALLRHVGMDARRLAVEVDGAWVGLVLGRNVNPERLCGERG